MPKPKPYEREKEYIKRCMSDSEMKSKHSDYNERYAVCKSFFVEYEAEKISFDYDDTLSTERGKTLAKHQQGTLYIISARHDKEGMLETAKALGIPESKVYATGSNKAKIEKIKELGINKHYDNNKDVIKQLGNIGVLF
jgi:soluble P-type ATPase